jgi:hypothetical protein
MTAAGGHAALAACGLLDFTCQVSQAVTSWFAGLVESAINPVLTVIGNDLLSTPQPGSFPAVAGMWGTSLAIADAAYVLLVLAGGILVMGYETVQVSTSAKEIAPRLVLGLTAANLSLILISRAVSLANGLAATLAGQGADPQTAGAALAGTIRNSVATGGVFIILLALVAVILALVLAVTYVLRLMGLILLTAVAPLALACYALPQTAWAARWWWRAMTAVLVIPAAQALVMTAAVKVFFTTAWVNTSIGQYLLHMIITICLLHILMRIPFWIGRPALTPFGGSPLRRAARFAFTAAVLSRVAPVLRGTAGRAGGGGGGAARTAPARTTAREPPARHPAPFSRSIPEVSSRE